MNWSAYIALGTLAICSFYTSAEDESRCFHESDEPPKDCDLNKSSALESFKTGEDFDRCAPYLLKDIAAREYIRGAAGRKITVKVNEFALQSIHILPRMLRDVSKVDITTTMLRNRVSMPIAASPSALQKLSSELGEIDTVRATSKAGTVMVLSTAATTLIEDVAAVAGGKPKMLWLQIYIYRNRSLVADLLKRGESSGCQAIVVTVDSPVSGIESSFDEVLRNNPRNLSAVNLEPIGFHLDPSVTFKDLSWVVKQTRLPVVAKGILTGDDAIQAAKAGVSAVLVSNHGGRQLDSVPATIDVLPGIVDALKLRYPAVQVYIDGGIRNGFDVFKCLALGAHVVFVGRPIHWGLAAGGENGVSKLLGILRKELIHVMMLAGTPNLQSISSSMVESSGKCEYPGIRMPRLLEQLPEHFTRYK